MSLPRLPSQVPPIFRRHRMFLLATMLVAGVCALIVFLGIKVTEETFYHSLDQESDVLEKSFNGLLERTYKNMEMIATFISNNSDVQQLFYRGKLAVESEGGGAGGDAANQFRDALYVSVSSSWKKIQQKFDARQLHFHLGPGSLSFLRVHRPGKYGDRMDDLRYTVVDTNAYLKPVQGFETGRVYSGLRGVVPVFATDSETRKEVHVGALEVGTSFKTVLNIFDNTQDVGAGVLLDRNHVEHAMWPDAVAKHFNGRVEACDCYLEAESRSGELTDLLRHTDNQLLNPAFKVETMLLPLNERYYGFSLIPLFDYKNSLKGKVPENRVGYIAFWFDRTAAYQQLQTTKKQYVLFGVAGFFFITLIMLLVVRFYIRHLTRQVEDKTHALQESADQLKAAQRVGHIGHWQWVPTTGGMTVSDQIYRMLGLEPRPDPDLGIFIDCVHPDDLDEVLETLRKVQNGTSCSLTHKVQTASGGVIYVRNRMQALRDQQGQVDRILGTVQDVSNQIELQKAIEAKERLYRQLFERNRAVKLLLNPSTGDIIDANDAAQRYYGYSHEELKEMRIDQINTLPIDELRAEFKRIQDENRDCGSFKHRLASGEIRDVEVYTSSVEYDDQCFYHSIIFDVTERNKMVAQLQKAAMHDSLTGLFNRRSVDYRAESEVADYQRSGQVFSVMMLDIDHFKHFNDTYGHDVGDIVLKAVASLIESQVRSSDLVGRFGGEEFIVLAPDTNRESAIKLAERIISAVREHETEIHGERIRITLSAGVATLGQSYVPETVADLRTCFYELVKHADEHLYDAKAGGRDRVSG